MRLNFGSEVIDHRYVMKNQLGKGGMGAVYQAYDRLTGEEVALKLVLAPPKDLSFNSRDGGMNLYLALAQEFKVLASLRHPNIISVLNYGFDAKQRPYFTMDLLSNAESPARTAWNLDAKGKVKLLIDILQALAYLHRRGIIHRDLKPGNVRVVNGQVKVLDFGLSILSKDVPEKAEKIIGTIEYMPPEMLRGAPASVGSDLYAVGVIGFEIFTGEYLFDAPNVRQLAQQIFHKLPDPTQIGDAKIAAVLMRLLSKNPEDRYATADETIAALSQAIGEPVPQETAAIRESFLQAATLVGRDPELAQLTERLEAAKNGTDGAILIGGESGVGKSRLLDELRTRALVDGWLVLRGEAMSQGRTPYQIWREVLRRLALGVNLDKEDAAILKTIIPDLDKLLDTKIKDSELDPDSAQRRLLLIAEKMFRQQQQPIVVILEDLHWAGSESYALLRHLVQQTAPMGVLFIASYRDDEMQDLPDTLPMMELMTLKRLESGSVEELAVAMLGEPGRDNTLLSFLNKETEGNVFFLVEVLRALAEETGKLSDVSSMQLPTHVFTGGVERIIQRRLSRVPEEIHPMLQTAALYGRYLDLRLLNHLFNNDPRMESWLGACSNAAVLDIQDGSWRFAHEKLREGLERQVDAEKGKQVHQRLAQGIESVHLYSPEFTTALAYHYTQAGDQEKAVHYSAVAGEQVLRSGAYNEAVDYLGYALEHMPANPDTEQAKRQANLTRAYGIAHQNLGKPLEAFRIFKDAIAVYETANFKWGMASALSDLGHTCYAMHQYEDSYNYFRESIQVAMSVRAQQVALAGIVGIARLMNAAKKQAWAVELCGFVLDHVAVDQQTAERAEDLLAQIQPLMAPEAFQQAQEAGKTKRLSEVVEELI